jgi:hypothetical protein
MIKELKKITPNIAKEILSTNNKNNRKLSQSMVEEIKNDILEDKFDIDNTFVVILDGNLYYGQHTLNAIIEAGKELELYMISFDSSVDKNFNFMLLGLNAKSKYKYPGTQSNN